jgi:hypothetical protein
MTGNDKGMPKKIFDLPHISARIQSQEWQSEKP